MVNLVGALEYLNPRPLSKEAKAALLILGNVLGIGLWIWVFVNLETEWAQGAWLVGSVTALIGVPPASRFGSRFGRSAGGYDHGFATPYTWTSAGRK